MGVMNERDPLERSDPRTGSDPGQPDRPQSADELFRDQIAGYGVIPGETLDPRDDAASLGGAPSTKDVLSYIQQAAPQADEFFQQKAQDKILSVYRAARNEHPPRSRYHNPLYKTRAAFHRPKTRSAIRRVQTAAANALFTTRDPIQMNPGDESNPQQRAAAAVRRELVNYRLSRASNRNTIPWFQVAIGARTDAYCTGYTVSLQTWAYRKRVTGKEPIIGNGGFDLSAAAGQPVERTLTDIVIDRPDITLYPIENVGLDPGAPWEDPAQGGSFLYLKDAVYSHDIRVQMEQGRENGAKIPWRNPADVRWDSGRTDPNPDSRAVRVDRADGTIDRLEDNAARTELGDGNRLVWRYLWFFRWKGEDYCVYTLGTRELLSDPIPTAEAFPHLGGQRPVVIGTDIIAPHDVLPMSNAAALQPMQQEINEQVNLRIDALRQSTFPLAKVKRGRNIDITSLTKRGPSSNVLVDDKDDVTYETIPNGAAALFQEMDRLNNDFDESAGIFSNSSVQGQRAMNETVGGMKILAGDAQAVANLELRIWTETWVERVIQQVSLLCAYYETDAKVLAICGQRAELAEKFGVSVIDDELLMSEVQTVVDVGTGSTDPNEAIGRWSMAMQALWPYAGPEVAAGRLMVKVKEMANEVFSHAQYKDGGDRFFEYRDEGAPTPEAMQQLQQQLDEVNAELAALKQGKEAEKAMTKAKLDTELAMQEAEFRQQKQMLVLQSRIDQINTVMQGAMGAAADQRKAGFAAQADERKGQMAAASDERKANAALEGDIRRTGMAERSAKRADQSAAQASLIDLQKQIMLAPPAPPPDTTSQLAPPPSSPGPPPGAGGAMPPGPDGAPPAMPAPGGALPSPEGMMPPGPPPPAGGPPMGPGGPPDMGPGMDELTNPVVEIMQQAMQAMAQQLIVPMQQALMQVAQEQAQQQGVLDVLVQMMNAPQKVVRGEDGRVSGAQRDVSGIDLSRLTGAGRQTAERMLAAFGAPVTAERGEDGRVSGTRRNMN